MIKINWTFNPQCSDCKYCIEDKCTHPNYMYCFNCSLWTPKWYKPKTEIVEEIYKNNYDGVEARGGLNE